MKSTFAGTKSTGPLNSVSATLNTAAERARHMKTSPHVDSTARMVPISSNAFKFQQQTLKTSQDISRHLSLQSNSVKKRKHQLRHFLLTNLYPVKLVYTVRNFPWKLHTHHDWTGAAEAIFWKGGIRFFLVLGVFVVSLCLICLIIYL